MLDLNKDKFKLMITELCNKINTKIEKNEYFILINQQPLIFTNNICTISDSRITADSLADVYFTSDTILQAEKSIISIETYNGYLELIAQNIPTSTIKASIKIRVA